MRAQVRSNINIFTGYYVPNDSPAQSDIADRDLMPEIEIKFKATLKLDEQWVDKQTTEELIEYIKAKINSSLGFRGQVKKLTVVSK